MNEELEPWSQPIIGNVWDWNTQKLISLPIALPIVRFLVGQTEWNQKRYTTT